LIEALLAALFGLIIGSFLNVCIYRLPRDLSVLSPVRSFCPACEKTIAWYDNLPIASYVLLRAKCRHCAETIPWRYPLVELLTSAAFFAAVLRMGPNLGAIELCLFAAILIALVFSDLEERILPDEFTLGGTIAGIAMAFWIPRHLGLMQILLSSRLHNERVLSALDAAFSAGACAFVLWAVGALYFLVRHKEGLGFGDVKMVAMIGSFLGLQGALLTTVIGSVLGSVIGIAFIMILKKDAGSYELPFGSFLGVAALGIAFWQAGQAF
jgi:leader peptidase (prepilin peptidase) / N-methyltransferase